VCPGAGQGRNRFGVRLPTPSRRADVHYGDPSSAQTKLPEQSVRPPVCRRPHVGLEASGLGLVVTRRQQRHGCVVGMLSIRRRTRAPKSDRRILAEPPGAISLHHPKTNDCYRLEHNRERQCARTPYTSIGSPPLLQKAITTFPESLMASRGVSSKLVQAPTENLYRGQVW
jgi:hypothetical protein